MVDYINKVVFVIFDWDGCLIDSFQLSYECYRKALKKFDIIINKEIFKKNYSPDWLGMYRNFKIEKNIWTEINDIWSKIYSKKFPPLRDGAKKLLFFLNESKIKIVLLSGGSRKRVLNELQHHSLLNLFSLIICQEDQIVQKPNPKLLFHVLDCIKCCKKDAIYIGDTHYDAIMGKNAGMKTIIVRSDYSNTQKITKVRPDYFVDNLIDVEKILREIFDKEGRAYANE